MVFFSVADKDHSDCDCVGIAIITHGDRDEESGQDILIGTDLNGISIAELLEPLMHVESLKKKPKLVIVEVSLIWSYLVLWRVLSTYLVYVYSLVV